MLIGMDPQRMLPVRSSPCDLRDPGIQVRPTGALVAHSHTCSTGSPPVRGPDGQPSPFRAARPPAGHGCDVQSWRSSLHAMAVLDLPAR